MKRIWGWVGQHSVALDVGVVAFLAFTLVVNVHTYVNSPPWGWFAGGFLASALFVRVWALAWAKGYAAAATERRDTIAQQAAMLQLQAETLKNSVPLPVVVMDEQTKQITVRTFINLN